MKPAKELANAAGMGDEATVQAMLRADPSLAKDWQPITDACFVGNVSIVKLLLEQGADPNILSKSAQRYRPLHRTVEYKVTVKRGPRHVEVVKLLLAAGADPMLRACGNQVTALVMAASGGESRFIPLLLEKAPRELDIFHAAALLDQARVESLLAGDPGRGTAVDVNGWQALRYAAASRLNASDPALAAAQIAIIRRLVDLGANPEPALGPALWSLGNAELADLLFAAGARIHDGDTIVHTAEKGPGPLLDLFVKYGVDMYSTVGTEHHGGYTPLGCLLTMRKTEAVRALLNLGVSPNRRSGPTEETALHVAAKHGCSPDALALLLDHGADMNARDSGGQTALALAVAAGKAPAAEFLRGRGALA
jgi:uncharacterized protein